MRYSPTKRPFGDSRFLIAALLILTTVGCAEPPSKQHVAVGKRLARIELVPLTGDGPSYVGDELKGKVVLLNFWGTWCSHCTRELPEIAELYNEYEGNDEVVILAVSIGEQSMPKLRKDTDITLTKLRLTLPTYADLRDATWGSYLALGMEAAVPTTIILDRDGVIRAAWTGPANRRELRETIQELLKKQG